MCNAEHHKWYIIKDKPIYNPIFMTLLPECYSKFYAGVILKYIKNQYSNINSQSILCTSLQHLIATL